MTEESTPTTIVIFGASGDLTARKLLPALYSLHRRGRLPAGVRIVGAARRLYANAEFRDHLRQGVMEFAGATFDADAWRHCASQISYFAGDVTQPQAVSELKDYLERLEGEPARRLYYLAVAPELYVPIVQCLGELGLARDPQQWRRIVVEKPFGHDLASAHALNDALHQVFDEDQIYRIDHYLGKETAQNILFLRFANTIFEPIWNRNYVDHVQITVAEAVDVAHRGSFYDKAGVVRDMFQNHLLQLLALVAMEPPASFNADQLRNEKVKVLSAIRPVPVEDTVRGQYEGYREASGVAAGSSTPTFAAVKLHIDNWRWQGVPFYLRSGKALGRKVSEIVIEFKCPPHRMFGTEVDEDCFPPNILSLCIQPDEGIHLCFQAKVPGSNLATQPADLEFTYRSSFGDTPLPDAYERLLLDALNGDASLFTRSDEIEESWRIVEQVLCGWEQTGEPPVHTYRRGSWGPRAAGTFMAADGRVWRQQCGS
jgi:glucose-6-phosphate 1-dehydrogenase